MAGSSGGLLGTLFILVKTRGELSGLNKTDKALQKTAKNAQKVANSVGLIGKLSKIAFGGVALYKAREMFTSYLQFEKDLGAMKSRFYAITRDETKAQEEFDYIRKLAVSTANDIKSTADSYSIFYAAARRSLGQEGARGIFEEWTKISRVLHLSEAQFERVTYALREMSSKGQLYSQDLKIQLGTHVPDAINIAEEAIKNLGIQGVSTVDEFQKLTKRDPKGGWMPKFLIEFSKVAGNRYATPDALEKAMQQPDALEQQIRNMITEIKIMFSQKGGMNMVLDILTGVRDGISSIDAEAWTGFFGFISKIFGFLGRHIPEIITLLRDIAIIYLGRMLTKSISRFFNGILRSVSMKNLQYIFRKGFIAGLAYMRRGLILSFKNIIAKAGILGIKGVLSRLALRFIPFVGQALLFFDIVKTLFGWAKKKFGIGDSKGKEQSDLLRLGDTEIPTQKVVELAKQLEKSGIKSSYDVQQAFNKAGLGGATKYLSYDFTDQRKIYISIDGSKYSPDELASKITETINKDKNLPSRPSDELLKELYDKEYGGWR